MTELINKASWPRTSHGTIDWEAVFEEPGSGLIPLVESAHSAEAIVKVVRVIIEALFTRQSDRPLRDGFLTTVDDIATQDLTTTKKLSTALLREVKDDRIARATAFIKQKKSGRASDTDATADPPETGGKQENLPPFNTALAQTIEKRLVVLRGNGVDGEFGGTPLPFPLSRKFCEHLMTIIAEHVAPALAQHAAEIISKSEKLPEADQVKDIVKALDTKKHREALWEHWCVEWKVVTEQAKDHSVWDKICQPSDSYQPPLNDDNEMLMGLFARTPDTMDRQSTALYQIAGQGEGAKKAFEEYRQGKDVDAALLSACYQEPNVFIASGFLKDIMRDHSDDVRHETFPLTIRFLSSRIK
ncbi:MAG: hypothetical protein HN644_02645 [Rhodospirillales bacterium]|nr:hypothetical protein [Rhodospirillales bacterium]MBT4040409.1 hypothetical protein [Rhodospirillales bacterium]MBT4625188.1 hypothetical protein [Rhodospirillales bacterium]MBT5351437.1 hypothetical protein [Rhodospirillales bacterium]MBT5521974.1 hypothetical protein [Rhodospirillales bacterium]